MGACFYPPMNPTPSNTKARLPFGNRFFLSCWCIVAAFGAYACMYAFRKPFTAGTYMTDPFTAGFKTWLVLAQVLRRFENRHKRFEDLLEHHFSLVAHRGSASRMAGG